MPGTLAHPVRDARPSDAGEIAQLLTELGYPVSPERLGRRLQVLAGERATRVFVAEAGGELFGGAAVHLMHKLERGDPSCPPTPPVVAPQARRRGGGRAPVAPVERDDPSCRLTALVVAPEARGRGVGRALFARAEREARGRGCVQLEVTTAEHRAGAHEFYERMGFEQRPKRNILELRA